MTAKSRSALVAETQKDVLAQMTHPRGKRKPKGSRGMNGWEKAYFDSLAPQCKNGEIEFLQFEAISLRLAPGVRYTPDFLVVWSAGVDNPLGLTYLAHRAYVTSGPGGGIAGCATADATTGVAVDPVAAASAT